jgi:mono/diheme cytochrome c family protein
MNLILAISTAFLFTAASGLAAAQQSPVAAPANGAPGRGQLLYDTHCIQCHTSQIHWRVKNSAHDWATLRAQVERWQGQVGNNWSDGDIDAVAHYLNDTIYHYPVPQKRG